MFLLCVQTEMELDVGVGRGYRYYTGVPVFEFGKCISHTRLYIAQLRCILLLTPGDIVCFILLNSTVALHFALDSRPT